MRLNEGREIFAHTKQCTHTHPNRRNLEICSSSLTIVCKQTILRLAYGLSVHFGNSLQKTFFLFANTELAMLISILFLHLI